MSISTADFFLLCLVLFKTITLSPIPPHPPPHVKIKRSITAPMRTEQVLSEPVYSPVGSFPVSAAFVQDARRFFLILQASLIVDSRCSFVNSNCLSVILFYDHRILTDKSKKIITPSCLQICSVKLCERLFVSGSRLFAII